MKKIEIIDIDRKGNLLRIYLGCKEGRWGYTNQNYKDYTGKTPDWLEPSNTYYGDDWNDKPYEHNAGKVYDEFIKGYVDCLVPFDYEIYEPCDDVINSDFSMQDFVARKAPLMIIYKPKNNEYCNYQNALTKDNNMKLYLGDTLEILENNDYLKIVK